MPEPVYQAVYSYWLGYRLGRDRVEDSGGAVRAAVQAAVLRSGGRGCGAVPGIENILTRRLDGRP